MKWLRELHAILSSWTDSDPFEELESGGYSPG